MDNFFSQCDTFVNAFLPAFPQNQGQYFKANWDEFFKLLQQRPLDYNKIYTLINKMKYEEIEQSQPINQTISRNNTLTQQEEKSQSNQKNSNQSHIKGVMSTNSNLTAASSPRIVSTNQKSSTQQQNAQTSSLSVSNNLINKFSQMDTMQSPKIALSNLSSQQQLINKNSLQANQRGTQQVEDFNRHLLLSKTKELLFSLSVSTDKLNAMAKLPMFSNPKENLNPKSPIKTHGISPPIQNPQPYQVVQNHQNVNSVQMHFNYPIQNAYQNQHHPIYVNNNGIKPRGSNHSAEHYSMPQRAII